MSNMPTGDKLETQQQQQKGPEAFLSGEERKQLGRMLGFPEDIPTKFKSWMQDYLSVNFPQIPITQISGFEKYLYKKGTELPADPKDGQTYTYIADSSAGIAWRFQYNESSGSAYKWEFVGGAPFVNEKATEESTTATSYVSLSGPGVTLPLAGDYLVQHGCAMDQVNDDSDVRAGVYNGSTTNLIIEGEGIVYGPGGHRVSASRSGIVNVASPSTAIEQRYSVGSYTGYFRNRWILVQPVRVKRA